MQDHQSFMILDLINEEIQDIFSLVDKIPYHIMLKIIGLNGVLMDQVNDKDKAALKAIADKMGISEDSLRASDILSRINKLNKMMFDAYLVAIAEEQKREMAAVESSDNPLLAKPKSKKVEALAADEMFAMLVELMQRNQGKNISNLLKMQEFCNRLAIDIGKTELGRSATGMQLMMFLGATQHVLGATGSLMHMEEKYQENDDNDDDLQLSAVDQRKKKMREQEEREERKNLDEKIATMAKLPAAQRAIAPEIKIRQISGLARQFTDSSENEVLRYYREIYAALKADNIPEAINLLAKLGKLSTERDIAQQLLIGMHIDDMPPINLLVVINQLNEKYKIFSDPLLIDGCKAFETLIGSHRFEKEAQAVPRIGLSYVEHVSEALFNWDKSRSIEVTSYEDPVFDALKIAIQALKKEADNFESPFDRLRVINLANDLHKSLDYYASSAKRDKSTMLEMQNNFREMINTAGLLVQPLTFREKISHILLTVERMIKEKVTDKKESRYKFYSAKKQLSDKLGVAEKIIKNIDPANDPMHSPRRVSKK